MGSLQDGILIEQWKTRAQAAEADLLAVREALADVIDERDKAEAECERLRGIVGAARLLILLAKPAYNAPLSWDEDRAVWLTANTSQDNA